MPLEQRIIAEKPPTVSLEETFQKRRDFLFDKIVQDAQLMDMPTRAEIVARVFEHSVEDGKRLADRLSLPPLAYQSALLRIGFACKHPAIYREFLNENKQPSFQTQEDKSYIASIKDLEKFQPTALIKDGAKHLRRAQNPKNFSAFPFKEIDQLYLDVFMTRGEEKIKKERIPSLTDDGLTNGERLAERYLLSIQPLLEERYYTGLIQDAFPQLAQAPNFFRHFPQITKMDLRKLLAAQHLPVDETLQRLAHARVTVFREIHAVERGVTIKALVKEIKDVLPEGLTVILDTKNQKYQVGEDENKKTILLEQDPLAAFEAKALEELERLKKAGADKDFVAEGLLTFHNPLNILTF